MKSINKVELSGNRMIWNQQQRSIQWQNCALISQYDDLLPCRMAAFVTCRRLLAAVHNCIQPGSVSCVGWPFWSRKPPIGALEEISEPGLGDEAGNIFAVEDYIVGVRVGGLGGKISAGHCELLRFMLMPCLMTTSTAERGRWNIERIYEIESSDGYGGRCRGCWGDQGSYSLRLS